MDGSFVYQFLMFAALVVGAVVIVVRRRTRPLRSGGVLVGLSNGAQRRIHHDLLQAAAAKGWELSGADPATHRQRYPGLRARNGSAHTCDGVVEGRSPRPFVAESWQGRSAHLGGVATPTRLHDLTFRLHPPTGAVPPRFCAAPLVATRKAPALLPEEFWGAGHVGTGILAWGSDLDEALMQWIASLAQPLSAAGCWLACFGDRIVLFGIGEPPLALLEQRIALGAWIADTLETPRD